MPYYQQKSRFKRAICSALDDVLKEKNEKYCKSELPKIPMARTKNITSFLVLNILVQNIFSANIKRGVTFLQVTFTLVSV
jgi:hypothetical protein